MGDLGLGPELSQIPEFRVFPSSEAGERADHDPALREQPRGAPGAGSAAPLHRQHSRGAAGPRQVGTEFLPLQSRGIS